MANSVSLKPGQQSIVTLVYLDANGNPDPGPNPTPVTGVTATSSDPGTTSVADNGNNTFTADENVAAVVGAVTTLTFVDGAGLTGTGTVTCIAPPFVAASIGVDFGTPTP